jgi:curved DNA-binding protein CbpA
MDETQFKVRVEQIFSDLERYSYYEILNLEPQVSPDEVRAAFHRMALSMHPDRYESHPDPDLRKKVYTIYMRMTEAYRVLMNPSLRKEYQKSLEEGQLRLVQTDRKRSGPKREEEAIEHLQAKKFFLLGLTAERQGNLKSARMNYKLALDFVGEHPLISEHLKRLDEMEPR